MACLAHTICRDRTSDAERINSFNATVAELAAGIKEDLVAGAVIAVALRKTIEHQPDRQSRLISTFGHPSRLSDLWHLDRQCQYWSGSGLAP